MNHCVPEFDMDEDYPNPTSSGTPSSSSHSKRPSTADEDIMELLWHNGQLVMQNQNQRLPKTSSSLAQSSSQQQQQQLFMHEDEMNSWLHYPLVEDTSSFTHNFCAADLLYPPPPPSSFNTTSTTSSTKVATTTVPVRTTHVNISEPRPPPKSSQSFGGGGSFLKQSMPPPSLFSAPMPRSGPGSEPSVQNIGLFSKYNPREKGPGPSSSKAVVDSNDTPTLEVEAAKKSSVQGGKDVVSGFLGTGGLCPGVERVVSNMTVASPRGSSVSGEPGQKQPVEDRKRRGIGVEEEDALSEDAEFDTADTKKQARGSTSSKKTRAAEVHNLSERRRRDRINEKMKALQELIPHCNKSDKASMLDEAIEYLKSLQMQVQMMSMGYGMLPMMYPGVQPYMPPMGMGMGLGMGMNMEMGMNRPMMPYPHVFPGSVFPTSGASVHMGPRYPVPPSPYHMPPAPIQDPSRIQAIQPDPMLNSVGAPNQIPPRAPLYPDPYQQYVGLPGMQLHMNQNQVIAQPSTSKPGSSGKTDDVDNPKSG